MSTRSLSMGLVLTLALANYACSAAQDAVRLGRPATPTEIAAWDSSIPPDGTGLPPGSGTPAQGEVVYRQKCQACHGEKGAGQPNDTLVGGYGTLASPQPIRTIGSYWPYATTVFDYIRRAMPYTQTKTLTHEEVYAVTAYLLHLNGIIKAQDVMNAQTLPQVQMPNRDHFRLPASPAPGETPLLR